ncbi:hypothetical protein HYV80_02105 [Candidatus Woesearchaeota archaeon]|nr:hypothetical protein [Candidatus Woesearchaeota archaeon]
MGIERTIAALASAFLIGINPGIANPQSLSKIPLEAIPLAQRGFNHYNSIHRDWKIPIPKSKKVESISESVFYYRINGSVVIEYVRNGKVADAFICSPSSVLRYYANNGPKGFEDESPEPNPSCNQNDFAKP